MVEEQPKIQVHMLFDPELWEKVKVFAAAEHRTQTSVVVLALEEWFRNWRPKEQDGNF